MAANISESSQQIRILKLVIGEHNESVLYRLKKGWSIHFMLGATLASRKVSVYCNVPSDNEPYVSSKYTCLKWNINSKFCGDKLDYYASVKLTSAGSFKYYFMYDGNKAGSGYFIVDPTLFIGQDNHELPLDAICMHTVMPKSLGSFSTWKERLQVSRECGYNAIHFTPIQQLGISNSSYSLADQLALNPKFSEGLTTPINFQDVKNLIEELRRNWMMLSVTDVVWNHTATNSPWLKKSPECAYNLQNSAYLRPAYILDRAIFHVTLDIEAGKYDDLFPSRVIGDDCDLDKLKNVMGEKVIPSLKLWEFFQVDIEKEAAKFSKAMRPTSGKIREKDSSAKIDIVQDKQFKRFGSTINMDVALKQFCAGKYDPVQSVDAFKSTIQWLNKIKKEMIDDDMKSVVNSIASTVAYERLDENGPKRVEINKENPLNTPYFHHPFSDEDCVSNEENMIVNDEEKRQHIFAHNGWVMGADALKNFAEYPGKVYFRRDLICWGDSVKLRYGSTPDDCPVLWERMKKYTEIMAEIFHGVRIDNCHSTPIHVAEYMLNAARAVRPELYVFAELFTGNEQVDNIFVNRLGITSLIREALNAWDSHELGRLVYLYGGEPIASFMQFATQLIKPSRAHALFYDVTHDNESMVTKRSIHDVVPSSALVTMACCAVGSNRCHDEMVPHHVHVVNEQRLYKKWAINPNSYSPQYVGNKSGFVKAKKLLNMLHQTMALNGFNQVFVDQRNSEIVAVTRHNPQSHHGYVIVAHTAFQESMQHDKQIWKDIPSLTIEGTIVGIVLEIKPSQRCDVTQEFLESFLKDNDFINGLENYSLLVETDLPIGMSACCEVEEARGESTHIIRFTDFPPGSIVVVRVKTPESVDENIQKLRAIITSFRNEDYSVFDEVVSELDLCTLNRVLFHCNEEELSDGLGIGVYDIPGWKQLCYCGIAGIAVPMEKIRIKNDLGHPICSNLREGNWLLDYISTRLLKHKDTQTLGEWYAACFEILGKLPRYLIPTYFESIISLTYEKLLDASWNRMSSFVCNGSSFIKDLSLGMVALCGHVKGADLPQFHPDVFLPKKMKYLPCTSMAAGLPHFSSGVMRCWGRDTFIAMHGLQLVTGQHVDAKYLILAFAGCLRHGLIPNLLAEGKSCRYNCRDAVWFWLQCIQDLCELSNYKLLQLPVARIFPTDDCEPQPVGSKTQPLYDVIQEALQRHIDGISFRERNAGISIDSNMSDAGFNVQAGISLQTGFVFGGNKHNCGTWMDKMGESETAQTKGIPATPRDGSAVELVALCKSAVTWLQRVNNAGHFPYDGVFLKDKKGNSTFKLTWSEWSKKIAKNFEKHFYVAGGSSCNLIHKQYIYKDTVGASYPWCDFQLRCNFPIAMVYAPELFNVDRAWKALEVVQKYLLGPLGMKTLDPDDLQYRGDYDNSNDSDDKSVAKGFNYHQGPEWLWPVGYFLRAKLYFARKLGPDKLQETVNFIQSYLVTHQLYIEKSSWCGLPELTNSKGRDCRDSCPIQAWSHATLLDVLYDLSKL